MSKQITDGEFVNLLTSSHARLEAFVLSLVRPRADADDVLQNACIALWEKRGNYDAERDFFPWACGVTLIEVARYRQKSTKDKLVLGEGLIETLSKEYVTLTDELDRRRQLLPLCIGKLGERDRSFLEDRYCLDIKPKEISRQRNLPLQTVYSTLARIRVSLRRCIEANLAQGSRFR